MVERYNHQVWTRAKWQQERDAARVAAGACARVSIATELDRFHNEMARGVGPGALNAARRLDERVRTYVEGVQQRFPAWARRVSAQLGDRVRVVQDDFEKIGRATDGYNKAIQLFKSNFENARNDVEDWMAYGGETRLNSRSVDGLVASLRELSVYGQLLPYVTDRSDRSVCNDARRLWSLMDGRRSPDRRWLEGVSDIRNRLRPV